jgi:hypothetical protein
MELKENLVIDPRCKACGNPYIVHKPSNNLKASSDTQQSTTSASYVKIKEITVADYAPKIGYKDAGKLRIKFDLATNNSTVTAYGRIYKNGNAFGTERTTTSTSPVTFTEDLEFKSGDLIQLYAHSNGSKQALVSNFRIYADAVCLECGYDETLQPKHTW